MKKTFLLFLLLFLSLRSPAQMWGISVNPDVDIKPQSPVVSYPFKLGVSYSAKLAVNIHFLYVFRVGSGIGFNHFSHAQYLPVFPKPGLTKIKSNWNNLCVPLKFIGCLPIRSRAMPMFEFQSNWMFPMNIYQVEKYGNDKVKNRSPYFRDAIYENIFRIGAIIKDDEGRNDVAVNFQVSFTNISAHLFRFVGMGVNVQYFFIVHRTGITKKQY